MRVQGVEAFGARLDLGAVGVVGSEGDLALQVRQGHRIVVDQPQRAHAGGGQIEGGRVAHPAHADNQHAGALQRLLAGAADLGQHQLAGVTLDLFVGKANRGGGGGRLGHAGLSSAVRPMRQAGSARTCDAVTSKASAWAALN